MTVVLANLFLAVAVVDDIVYRKFHNFLFIVFTLMATVAVALYGQISLFDGLLGFAVGFALFLPLVLTGVTGAGDMKLMMAVGLLVGPEATAWIIGYGMFWGSLMGLFKILLEKKVMYSLINLYNTTFSKKNVQASTKIPFTVALLLGWLTWQRIGEIL